MEESQALELLNSLEESVLYYAPEGTDHVGQIKGVLSQMGIKVKNLTARRCIQEIGYLAGAEGFGKREVNAGFEKYAPAMDKELLIFCGLSGERLEELLDKMKKAGITKTGLKAVITETNAHWTVYRLYRQLCEEQKAYLCR